MIILFFYFFFPCFKNPLLMNLNLQCWLPLKQIFSTFSKSIISSLEWFCADFSLHFSIRLVTIKHLISLKSIMIVKYWRTNYSYRNRFAYQALNNLKKKINVKMINFYFCYNIANGHLARGQALSAHIGNMFFQN